MGRFWVLPGAVLALALASPASAGHHGHGHGGLFLSFGVAAPAPLAPYPYAYYPYPYAEPYASPVVVQAVEPPAAVWAPPAAAATWYFCPAINAYYPYVADCPVAWQRQPARSAAALQQAPSPQPGSERRVLSRFRNASGQDCQEFEETIRVDGLQQRATGTACQGEDGRRAISPSPALIRESKN